MKISDKLSRRLQRYWIDWNEKNVGILGDRRTEHQMNAFKCAYVPR